MIKGLYNGKIESIADNLLLLIPAFYRNLLSGTEARSRSNPVNTELRSLFILSDAGIMPSSELGRKLGITKSNVTPLVDKLTGRGYTVRLPDGLDRRVINISITNKGRRFIAGRRRKLVNQIKRNLSELKQGELETLYASVQNFKDIVNKMEKERSRRQNTKISGRCIYEKKI